MSEIREMERSALACIPRPCVHGVVRVRRYKGIYLYDRVLGPEDGNFTPISRSQAIALLAEQK